MKALMVIILPIMFSMTMSVVMADRDQSETRAAMTLQQPSLATATP